MNGKKRNLEVVAAAVLALLAFPVFYGEGSQPLAQPYIAWFQRYDTPGDNILNPVKKIAVDDSGNAYITGTSQTSNFNITTIKYSQYGNQLWVVRYSGPANGSEVAADIAVDTFGNVYVTGSSTGIGTGQDFVTIKYYPTGDTAWVRRYNSSANDDDVPTAIDIDKNGNVFVTGFTFDGTTGFNYLTIKYSPAGTELWVRLYNGPANSRDKAVALAVDSSGNAFVTGHSRGNGTGLDFATIKYNPSGETTWVRRHNAPANGDDGPTAITMDRSGNTYVTGVTYNGPTGADYATIKYSPQGSELWAASYSGPANRSDIATAIVLDQNKNIFVTGFSDQRSTGFVTDSSIYATIKYDSSGNQIWVARYEGLNEQNDIPSAIGVDESGCVYVTGFSDGVRTDFVNEWDGDFATVKYDSLGNQLWVTRYDGPAGWDDNDGATDLVLDREGNVYVTGFSDPTTPFGGVRGDFVTFKFSPSPLLKGDLDGNGVLGLADVTFLLNCVFFGSGDCPPAFADVNCDGILTPVDVVILLNVFYLSATPPCANQNGKTVRNFV